MKGAINTFTGPLDPKAVLTHRNTTATFGQA